MLPESSSVVGYSCEIAKLTVFPADPLAAYVRKGVLKPRYYNPGGVFDAVQFVEALTSAPTADTIKPTIGAARLDVIESGWLERMSWRRFPRLRQFLAAEVERMLPRISAFEPDLIRAYTPQLPGFLAVECARRLGIPAIVSVHCNFDHDVREDSFRRGDLRQWASNMIQGWLVEHEVLTRAALVICAYQWPARYVRRHRTDRVEVVYNKVDTSRFHPVERPPRPFTILSVGRQIRERSPDTLVRAMVGIDARLCMIGNGELVEPLQRLAARLGVADRVTFVRHVPNNLIHDYYGRADVFAHATRYGGIHIPVIEAMAAGLPLVVAKPQWEEAPEQIGDIALIVERDPDAFRQAFMRLQSDPGLRSRLGQLGRARALELDGAIMEEREADLYREVLVAGNSGGNNSATL